MKQIFALLLFILMLIIMALKILGKGYTQLIGTRFATKISKDGQLVEVDATRSIVKIIK